VHMQGHLRDAFGDLVDIVEQTGNVPVVTMTGSGGEPLRQTTRQFLDRFAGCSDILPDSLRAAVIEGYRQAFGWPCSDAAAGTYARAARRIGEIRRGRTELVL
jgi:hypothetical protein